MPTFNDPSGTTDFVQTRDQLIARTLRQCSVISDGESPSASDIANCTVALNAMVKQWDATGIHLWTETEGVLFPQPSQNRYLLDPRNSTDQAAEDWALTSLASNAAEGDTSLVLGDINTTFGLTDLAIGDRIGITLDSGRVQWSGVTYPTAAALTIQTALTGSAASGNAVFLYRKAIETPLRIISARRLLLSADPTTLIETPLIRASRLDYREMPNKFTTGTISTFFYDPQLVGAWFYLWPSPLDASSVVPFTWHRRIRDFNAATDVPDLPQEWQNCIAWNLSREVGPEYDIPIAKYTIVERRALETMDVCMGFDKEPESIYFGCAFDPGSR